MLDNGEVKSHLRGKLPRTAVLPPMSAAEVAFNVLLVSCGPGSALHGSCISCIAGELSIAN
jgi:hypothetical protein